MTKPEQIPEEAWRAAMSAYHKTLRKNPGAAWQTAIAAALDHWPESCEFWDDDYAAVRKGDLLLSMAGGGDA
jgi:hypothetical protein